MVIGECNWFSKFWTRDKPCGKSLALVVATPAMLVALHVKVTWVSSEVTFSIFSAAAVSLYNILYFGPSFRGISLANHSSSGRGFPITSQKRLVVSCSLTGMSARGCVKCGAWKLTVTRAVLDVTPCLLVSVTVNSPTSWGWAESTVSLTTLLILSTLWN